MTKHKYTLNLQLFAEDDDDMILPDDYEETPSEESQEDTQDLEETEQPQAEDTKPADEATEPPTPAPFKLKYNGQEREVPAEEGYALMQKGLNYEKAQERAAQQARDTYIAEQGHVWNGKPVTTEAEYKNAIAEQSLMKQYEEQDLPAELVEELLAGRRDREERAKEREAQTAEAAKNADLTEFLTYFQATNERAFDPNKDAIPQSVWDAHNNGVPLRFAYMEHHNKELRNQLKIAKTNETNTKKAPVSSVTAHGSNSVDAEDDFMAGFNSV